jgi:hypothetical protein
MKQSIKVESLVVIIEANRFHEKDCPSPVIIH